MTRRCCSWGVGWLLGGVAANEIGTELMIPWWPQTSFIFARLRPGWRQHGGWGENWRRALLRLWEEWGVGETNTNTLFAPLLRSYLIFFYPELTYATLRYSQRHALSLSLSLSHTTHKGSSSASSSFSLISDRNVTQKQRRRRCVKIASEVFQRRRIFYQRSGCGRWSAVGAAKRRSSDASSSSLNFRRSIFFEKNSTTSGILDLGNFFWSRDKNFFQKLFDFFGRFVFGWK